jgi:hypothetical protein
MTIPEQQTTTHLGDKFIAAIFSGSSVKPVSTRLQVEIGAYLLRQDYRLRHCPVSTGFLISN